MMACTRGKTLLNINMKLKLERTFTHSICIRTSEMSELLLHKKIEKHWNKNTFPTYTQSRNTPTEIKTCVSMIIHPSVTCTLEMPGPSFKKRPCRSAIWKSKGKEWMTAIMTATSPGEIKRIPDWSSSPVQVVNSQRVTAVPKGVLRLSHHSVTWTMSHPLQIFM